ncbi:MAG: hypothetical protein HUK24_04185 [Sphaerochaetaceae bacterium]|nr:hypothetical protein [Sphaerochaetaceae bacterium]
MKNSFLVVSLNPTIQLIVGYSSITEGQVNRTSQWKREYSGKGFNVAKTLAKLGNKAILLTHCNNLESPLIRSQGRTQGFEVVAVEDPSNSRICVTVLQEEKGTTTELVSESPSILGKGTERKIIENFNVLLDEVSCVIITGTRSPGYNPSIYANMVRDSRLRGKTVILDLKGEDLISCLPYYPNIVKPNLEELNETFPEGTLQEKMEKLGSNCIITDGSNGAYIFQDGEVVNIPAKKVDFVGNTTGCGDAFTAAVAHSIMNDKSFFNAVEFGLEIGAKKASESPFEY